MTVPVLVAVGIGAAIALQAAAVSSLTDTVHPLAVSLALLASGLVVACLWATARSGWADAWVVVTTWWWVPLGALGWGIVAALGWVVARLGVAVGLSLVVGAQLVAALLVDLTRGAVVVGWRSLAGVALVAGGVALLDAAR